MIAETIGIRKRNYMEQEWTTISGFPNYEITPQGLIRRKNRGKGTYPGRILRIFRDKRGVSIVGLWAVDENGHPRQFARDVQTLVYTTFGTLNEYESNHHM